MSSTRKPSIFYSQNDLNDPGLVTSLLDRSSIGPGDLVLEIGPGKGIITEKLARHCREVIAVEKDPHRAALLFQKFAHQSNVTIVEGDFLRYRLPRVPYKVFANIPFNITSAIVTKLTAEDNLQAGNPPEDAYLAMQKEAASMVLGSPQETLRAVLLKPWFKVEIIHSFRRTDFVPEPRVDVVMLHLRKRGPPLVSSKNRQRFRDFVVHVFTSWQPTLGHALKSIFSWRQLKQIRRELKIDLEATPTAIPFEQWLDLFEFFLASGNPQAMHTISGSEKRLNQQQKKLHKVHRTRISRRATR